MGENTCDGKKKSYEVLAPMVRDLYVIDLPQMKSETGKQLLGEYRKFFEKLESVSGIKITAEKLRNGIRITNAKRMAVKRLARIRSADPEPISGLDALLCQPRYFPSTIRSALLLRSISSADEGLEERVNRGEGVTPKGTPRVLISGCPMGVPNWKVPHDHRNFRRGHSRVSESRIGERGSQWLTAEEGHTVGTLLDHITEVLWIDCAVFTPNQTREEAIFSEMF